MMLPDEILDRLNYLQSEAKHCDPMTMMLASVDERGRPTQRTVTMIQIDPLGLVFFTDSQSRKGQHFADRPYASASSYWHDLHEQVEFEGNIEVLDSKQADAHWSSRERDSQISAWASHQSQILRNKQDLLDRVEAVKTQFRDQLIPRPPHWLCYRIVPDHVEFWKSGWQILHERVCFDLKGTVWSKTLLDP